MTVGGRQGEKTVRGRAERNGQERQRRAEEGETYCHIMMGGDEGMNCRHAAVAVRWSRKEGGSASNPVFPDVQAD